MSGFRGVLAILDEIPRDLIRHSNMKVGVPKKHPKSDGGSHHHVTSKLEAQG
jgi:hypothetical protein